MKRNPDIVRRKIHDTCFLINIRQNYLNDKCYLFEMNEIGDFIWSQLDKDIDIESLTRLLLEKLVEPVPFEQVYLDIKEYVGILKEEGFILE